MKRRIVSGCGIAFVWYASASSLLSFPADATATSLIVRVLLPALLFVPLWFYHAVRPLVLVLLSIYLGLVVFIFLQWIGLVVWPFARSHDAEGFAFLLYCHFILVATVSASALLGRWTSGKDTIKVSRQVKGYSVMSLILVLVSWVALGTGSVVAWRQLSVGGPAAIFIVIAILKALLNGFSEEWIYRRIILDASVPAFGRNGACILQGVLFAIFHIPLTPAGPFAVAFLPLLFITGLIAGYMILANNRLFPIAMVHSAVDFFIEWENFPG